MVQNLSTYTPVNTVFNLKAAISKRNVTYRQFHQHFTRSFYARISQKHKKIDNLTVFF